MKIAVSATGKDIKSKVSDVFGRCPYFIIAEIEDEEIKEIKAIENKNANQSGGAGISAAQLMADENVNAAITGNVGPRALDVLRQFNIEVYSCGGIVKTVLQAFIDGKLKKIEK